MQIKILSRLVKLMFGGLILAFVYVLWRFADGPAQNSGLPQSFSQQTIGQTQLQRFAGKRLWITRLSDAQRRQAVQTEPYLLNPSAGCKREVEICALVTTTSRAGVEIRYVQSPPPQLPNQAEWFGGFVDPNDGAVFDLLGRAYRMPNNESQRAALDVYKVD